MVISLIQPKLGLRKKTDSAIESYAGQIINKLTLNAAHFPGIPLAALVTLKDDYSKALDKQKDGTKTDTIEKNNKRLELENALRGMANDCAEIANGDDGLFLMSGFEIKSKPNPSVIIEAPKNFNVNVGPFEGSLEIRFKSVKNAYAYEAYFGKFGTNPTDWATLQVTTAGKTLIGDLESNVLYSARVRAVGAKGKKGEWSEIVSRKTY